MWFSIALLTLALTHSQIVHATSLAAKVKQLTTEVSQLRQLTSEINPVSFQRISKPKLKAYLLQQLAKQYSDADLTHEATAYKMLGLMPTQLDYKQAIVDLIMQQIAGFYDRDLKLLYITRSLTAALQMPTIAHELVHALQDQHFDLNRFKQRQLQCTDCSIAIQALLEGDASYTTMLWQQQQAAGQGDQLTNATPRPHDWVETMAYFPYISGMRFVAMLYEVGGWERVNKAYTDLPQSSAEILYPMRYLTRPSDVSDKLPSLTTLIDRYQPSAPAKLIFNDVLGSMTCEALIHQPEVCQSWQADRTFIWHAAAKNHLVSLWWWQNQTKAQQFAKIIRQNNSAFDIQVDDRLVRLQRQE